MYLKGERRRNWRHVWEQHARAIVKSDLGHLGSVVGGFLP